MTEAARTGWNISTPRTATARAWPILVVHFDRHRRPPYKTGGLHGVAAESALTRLSAQKVL